MNIVAMQERHLAALAEIERACFHAPWSENMLREELGKGIFLVAEQDGRTAGYVGCQTVLDEGYITNVAVSPDFRRQGIARALIAELTAKAGENKLAFVLFIQMPNILQRFRSENRIPGFFRKGHILQADRSLLKVDRIHTELSAVQFNEGIHR